MLKFLPNLFSNQNSIFFLLPLKSPRSGPEYIYSPDCMCLQTFISLQLWLLIQARLCGWITKTTGSCHTADGRNECEWMKTAPCCLPPWTLCPREHSWCKTENNLSFHRFTPLLLHLLRAHRFYCFFYVSQLRHRAGATSISSNEVLITRSRSHSELRWFKISDWGC